MVIAIIWNEKKLCFLSIVKRLVRVWPSSSQTLLLPAVMMSLHETVKPGVSVTSVGHEAKRSHSGEAEPCTWVQSQHIWSAKLSFYITHCRLLDLLRGETRKTINSCWNQLVTVETIRLLSREFFCLAVNPDDSDPSLS